MTLRDVLLEGRVTGSPAVRRAVHAAKRGRRRMFERLGSDRYSHPALDDLDRKLAAYLPERHGVFVEAGGFDGYWQSNTYWFERFRGWSGVLVEPVSELAKHARRERPRSQVFSCALVGGGFPHPSVRMRVGGTMSTVIPDSPRAAGAIAHAEQGARIAHASSYEVEVPTRTLSAVLDEAGLGAIDLLSLDVEGHEPEVLRGLDLGRHAPRYMLIEVLDDQRDKPLIDSLLESRYELVDRLSGRDYLYRRRDP